MTPLRNNFIVTWIPKSQLSAGMLTLRTSPPPVARLMNIHAGSREWLQIFSGSWESRPDCHQLSAAEEFQDNIPVSMWNRGVSDLEDGSKTSTLTLPIPRSSTKLPGSVCHPFGFHRHIAPYVLVYSDLSLRTWFAFSNRRNEEHWMQL